jgi:hypothetical protein
MIIAITREIVRFHAKNVLLCSIGFYGASGGFSDATEGRVTTTSSEVNSIEIGWSVEVAEKLQLFLRNGKDAKLARLDQLIC